MDRRDKGFLTAAHVQQPGERETEITLHQALARKRRKETTLHAVSAFFPEKFPSVIQSTGNRPWSHFRHRKPSVSTYQKYQPRKWANKIHHQVIGSSVSKTEPNRWTNAQWTAVRFTTRAHNRNNDRYLLVRKNPTIKKTNLQLYPAIPSKLAEEQLQSRTGDLYDFSAKFRFHCRRSQSPSSSVEHFPIQPSQWSCSVNLDRIHEQSVHPPPTTIRYLSSQPRVARGCLWIYLVYLLIVVVVVVVFDASVCNLVYDQHTIGSLFNHSSLVIISAWNQPPPPLPSISVFTSMCVCDFVSVCNCYNKVRIVIAQ